MSRYLRLLALFLLTLAGCQLVPTATPPPASDIEPTPTPTQSMSPAASAAGQLAYLGGDGNVYITTPGQATPTAITTDATAAPERAGFSYHRIAWSPDGRLAFASVTRQLNQAPSQLYVLDSLDAAPRRVAQDDENFVIYIYWSPTPCPGRPNCTRLAYLIEEENRDIGLRLVEMESGQSREELLGLGRPFYFSWQPTGEQIITHTGGARRNNPQAQLAMIHLEESRTRVVSESPGLFWAPAWSPQARHWLGVTTQGATDQLQRLSPTEPPQNLAGADDDRHVAFAWSPDGNQVAYAYLIDPTDFLYGPIHLFDLTTGQTQQLTSSSFQLTGFFWSPDGQNIGYVTSLAAGKNWMQWRVLNLAREEDRGFNAFVPSYQMLYVLSSFNQYAQSHRFWSPDGRYLVYADQDDLLVERVWLVDTWAESGAAPLLVDEGAFGIWSWQ